MDDPILQFGIAGFAVWGLIQVTNSIIGLFKAKEKESQPQLTQVIQDNTMAIVKLTNLIDRQSFLIQQQSDELIRQRDLLNNIRVDIAKVAQGK